jgi:hypothetical protein
MSGTRCHRHAGPDFHSFRLRGANDGRWEKLTGWLPAPALKGISNSDYQSKLTLARIGQVAS